jgi:hypothetical protein
MAKFERKTSALDDRLHNTSETVGIFLVVAFHFGALRAPDVLVGNVQRSGEPGEHALIGKRRFVALNLAQPATSLDDISVARRTRAFLPGHLLVATCVAEEFSEGGRLLSLLLS